MNNIIERLEAATANDPELFEAAFNAVHGPKPQRVLGGSKELADWLAIHNQFYAMLKAGAFESAALTLVPEGCSLRFLTDFLGLPHKCTAQLRSWEHRKVIVGNARTLAICIAALKGRKGE